MEIIFSLLPMLIVFVLMYFMLIRPQKQAAEAKRQLIDSLKPGDGVVTIGGLHGLVDEVDPSEGIVVLDCEGVFLTFELQAIANVKQSVGNDSATEVEDLSPLDESDEEVEDDLDNNLEDETLDENSDDDIIIEPKTH
ncbi:preprotein translocase subunit YajC [Facklamia sp. DSM 111018]|uniref:Preprotein translocase subunit YajC n=1 Tax=Facklamia lactis TaxID=2749967 RepID=A0ABS0LP44_9LACT|nr:preprotein translocase subunit YajC [Facklamia lactis]MBG9980080.1 preprotein translocase subunit YajC [Facklamia lactis]MBG9985882.1 preprotein translocase subunit YajC [Facklamia lactis]